MRQRASILDFTTAHVHRKGGITGITRHEASILRQRASILDFTTAHVPRKGGITGITRREASILRQIGLRYTHARIKLTSKPSFQDTMSKN